MKSPLPSIRLRLCWARTGWNPRSRRRSTTSMVGHEPVAIAHALPGRGGEDRRGGRRSWSLDRVARVVLVLLISDHRKRLLVIDARFACPRDMEPERREVRCMAGSRKSRVDEDLHSEARRGRWRQAPCEVPDSGQVGSVFRVMGSRGPQRREAVPSVQRATAEPGPKGRRPKLLSETGFRGKMGLKDSQSAPWSDLMRTINRRCPRPDRLRVRPRPRSP